MSLHLVKKKHNHKVLKLILWVMRVSKNSLNNFETKPTSVIVFIIIYMYATLQRILSVFIFVVSDSHLDKQNLQMLHQCQFLAQLALPLVQALRTVNIFLFLSDHMHGKRQFHRKKLKLGFGIVAWNVGQFFGFLVTSVLGYFIGLAVGTHNSKFYFAKICDLQRFDGPTLLWKKDTYLDAQNN